MELEHSPQTYTQKGGWKELSSEEILQLIQGMNSIFSEEEPERANAQNRQSENVKTIQKPSATSPI